ncbi:uncharacterized protein LOC108258942 [Ictalurus punctatus]|uniref:Uncharacterized protein LOC108258942 n=1 Tax=Ictalurus punctatus TaxID=7998 RepID=A0A979ECK6_ICTPU|nr:uncharacterized protein LOC108258942 [Ictalurus punctatus]
MTTADNRSDSEMQPLSNIRHFLQFLILCLTISIILVLMCAFAILLLKEICVWRNRSPSSSSSDGTVSEKTGEARNRRPTYKEKTNSIYVQWKPEDSTSCVMSQFFDPAQDCQDGPPKQSMVSACHYSTT